MSIRHQKKCVTVDHYRAEVPLLPVTVAPLFPQTTATTHLCAYHTSFIMAKNKDKEKETARVLYMAGETQESIAERVGVSRISVNRWVKQYEWEKQRAARTITRSELTNKLLVTIDRLIEQVNNSDDPKLMENLGDRLSKMSAVVEKLDKKANIVNVIEVFMAFSKWLEFRSKTDPDITPDFLKVLNKYQDKYIMESMSGGRPL